MAAVPTTTRQAEDAAAPSSTPSAVDPRLRLPKHPERICWGCDKHCPADDLACGEDKARAPHPMELFGDDWAEWALDTSSDRV